MTKFKYYTNTTIGPYDVWFKERLQNGYGIFECPYCGNNFKAKIGNVVDGSTRSCGCLKENRKVKDNSYIGPYKILLKKRLDNGKGLFECPVCHSEFTAFLSNVQKGQKKNCGCIKNFKYHNESKIGPYNMLLLRRLPPKNGVYKGIFKCSRCGKNFVSNISNIATGRVKSCGCFLKESHKIGYHQKYSPGEKVGKLTLLEKTDKRKRGQIIWKAKCDCGNPNIIEVSTASLYNSKYPSCGCTNNSLGESKIKDILQNMSIIFNQQKTFQNCINPKTNKLLRFDFYLPDYNCCIEYDGEQHFSTSGAGYFSDINKIKEIQYRDNIKNEFCDDNRIKLIRIPYWDFDILDEKYLKEKVIMTEEEGKTS